MGIVGRLLVLFAVLLMPLGMEPADAAAANHHATVTGMAMEHCPDPLSKHQHNDGLAMCSMACASALPAQELVRDETSIRRPLLVMPMASHMLHGLHPDTATPPPKLA